MAESSREYGPEGYIYHLSSTMPIGPAGGSSRPTNDTGLVVYGTKPKDSDAVLQFQFVRVKEFGHFGYIQHVNSNKIVHYSTKNKSLVLREEENVHALFAFDLENYMIMHRNGEYWHVKQDNPTPENGTICQLQEHKVNASTKDAHIYDTAKFYFGDSNARHVYPYSSPSVSAHWKLLQAFIAPKTPRSLDITYKVGREKESSRTVTHAWKVSAELAFSFIKSVIGYDGSISLAKKSVLTEEKTHTLKIEVPGSEHQPKTVCVWQYVYRLNEYDDEIRFLSNIICDTDSLDKKPDSLDKKPDKKSVSTQTDPS